MLGRSHRFLGIISTFWEVYVPCSRTQHGLTRVGLEPPTSGSGVRDINHQATALPMIRGSHVYFSFFLRFTLLNVNKYGMNPQHIPVLDEVYTIQNLISIKIRFLFLGYPGDGIRKILFLNLSKNATRKRQQIHRDGYTTYMYL